MGRSSLQIKDRTNPIFLFYVILSTGSDQMNYLKKHKKFTITYLILIILSLSIIIFTYNNHSFYKNTIAKIDNIKEKYINTEEVTYVSVIFDRATFNKINLDAIDPSDALSNFEYNMKFGKTTGFKPVVKLTDW